MERQTAVILEGIFGGICALFALLWLFLVVIPAFITIADGADAGTAFLSMFTNVYFWWMLVFLIPGGIFSEIKKNIDKRPVQRVVYVPQPQQQQQQQQVIQVNVPPVPSPPVQYYTTAAPSPLSQPPPQPQITQSEPPAEAIYCIRCGARNIKFAKFCKVCGATIE